MPPLYELSVPYCGPAANLFNTGECLVSLQYGFPDYHSPSLDFSFTPPGVRTRLPDDQWHLDQTWGSHKVSRWSENILSQPNIVFFNIYTSYISAAKLDLFLEWKVFTVTYIYPYILVIVPSPIHPFPFPFRPFRVGIKLPQSVGGTQQIWLPDIFRAWLNQDW